MNTRILRRTVVATVSLAIVGVGCEGSSSPEMVSLTLATAGSGSGSLTASPAGPDYPRDAAVSITAAPGAGSAFTGWERDCGQSTNPCSVTMSGDRSVIGHFVPSTGVGQYDGAYSGTWSGGQSSGANLNGPFTLTISSGVVQGDFSPISGSQRALAGTVSAGGAFSGTIPAAPGGCAVNIQGQITTSLANGITGASAQGSYTLAASASCNTASGTLTATRQLVNPD